MTTQRKTQSVSIDRAILVELKHFFRITNQTNWGKNQILAKIDEIEREVCFEGKDK